MTHRIKTPSKTPVSDLLELVWDNAQAATSHSWERLNHAMETAFHLAIGAGFQFQAEDLDMSGFRADYWFDSERAYTRAIREGNISACQAIEAWKKRKPFILDRVRPPRYGSQFAHMSGARQRGRIGVGCTFLHDGAEYEVTSFAVDGSYLNAVLRSKGVNGKRKRLKLTHDGIYAARKAARASASVS